MSLILSRLLLTFFLSCVFFTTHAQHNNLTISNTPSWVNRIDGITGVDIEGLRSSGGYTYLLIDFQTNAETEERFRHITIRANNSEGVQQMSDLTFDFDPLFQEIAFHQINIIRGGEIIKKLDLTQSKVIQREQNAERFLYDGNLTAVFNLSDIRAGDILDYSFTKRGFNPVYKKKFSTYFNLNYSDPVERIYKRFVIDNNRKIDTRSVNNVEEPTITTQGGLKEYVWDVKGVEQIIYDNNVPNWHDEQKSFYISEFPNWNEVVDWALPMYAISENDKMALAKKAKEFDSNSQKEEEILNMIRFVQDEVRYLGFESGLNTMKPHSPIKVLDQRFGDCKDKSLLLVGLLNAYDIEAYPMLVHSSKGKTLGEKLPSPDLFNHCVVQLKFNQNTYYVDPTIQSQGGSLENLSFPHYKQGLVLSPENNELVQIEYKNVPELILQEFITVNEDGSAEFTVRSEYYGSKADYIRSYSLNNTMADIKKEYVNFYSGLYPEIGISRDVQFIDNDRSTANKLVVEEFYDIDNIWRYNEDSSRQYFEVYPLILANSISFPNTANRKMPYYVGGIEKIYQKSTISMYEDWNVSDESKTIENAAFGYLSSVSGNGNKIFIDYDYKVNSTFVSSDQVRQVVDDATSLSNDLSFHIYKKTANEGFELSWTNVILVLLTIGGSFALILKFNGLEIMNPLPPADRLSEEVFGGWLILVMIGIAISPVYQAYSLFLDPDYFDSTTLSQLWNWDGSGSNAALYFIVEFELVWNTAFFCFTCYFAYCFFSKRTNVPFLATIFYGASLLLLIIDTALLQIIVPELFSEADRGESYYEILKSSVSAVIWIPYFNLSERVKKTFVRVAHKYHN